MHGHRRARAEDRRTHEPARHRRSDPSRDPTARSEGRLDPGARRRPDHADRRRHGAGEDLPVTAPEDKPAKDPEVIKAEIDATREQLCRTVDELSRRLDVPARAKEGVYRARDTAVETYRESPPVVIAAALALVAAAVGLVVWRSKRSQPRRK